MRNVTSSQHRPVEIVVVRSPACHLCEDAIEALDEMRARSSLDVRLVEMESEEGRDIVARHRPALFPAVLVEDRLFSSGRLPRRKLERILARGG
ncbi:MAG TPA: glutaredoxin [Actinomycetota bacterium]